MQYWRDAHDDAFFEMELSVEEAAELMASIRQQPLGPIGVSRIELNTGQVLARTRQAIARCRRPQFEFIAMQGGSTLLSQGGKDTLISAGDCVLIDNRLPYKLVTTASCQNLVLHIPVSWMQLWIPCPEEISALPIRGNTPWGKVLQSLFQAARYALDPVSATIYADQIAGAICLAHQENIGKKPVNRMDCLYKKAIDILHESAHQMGFAPGDLASLLNISVRYTHKVFARHGTTFSSKLLENRLNSAARMLADTRFARLPIAEICWRNGFCDPSHFSRCFSKRFGISPGQFRLRNIKPH